MWFALFATVCLSTGCDGGSVAGPQADEALALNVTSADLAVGDTVQLRVNRAGGEAVAWASSDPAVAAVSSTGVVTGVGTGEARVTATRTGRTASAVVEVSAEGGVREQGGAPDLASHDFEDGGLGPFTYPWAGTATPEDLRVVPDPTGSGRGKVLRVDYTDTRPGQDLNRALFFPRSPRAYGAGDRPLFFRTDLRLGTWAPGTAGAGDQRKLVYWKDESSGYTGYTLLVLWGNTLRVEQAYVLDGKHVYRQADNVARLAQNRWYTLEVQVTPNSTPSASDGVLRVWIDGALVHQWTNVRFFPTADYRYRGFGLGYQLQTATATGNETRYFDRVAFSTRRIGP